MNRLLFTIIYYGFARYLPNSYSPLGGIFNALRVFCVKRIFKRCGKISTINRMAYFGNGKEIEIGDGSGIGANCKIPNNIKIGKYVMMGPDVYIASNNHKFSRIDIPMSKQGYTNASQTIIDDDCWIGARVIMTAGRYIKKGSIIGIGSVLTKDFEEYSVVGGNPAKLLYSRKQQ